jgi:molybdopterin molybdotransferase
MSSPQPPQRIGSLTPWSEALATVERLVAPVAPRSVEATTAAGGVLVEDIVVSAPVPKVAIALRDGWAVRADLVADAGPYAPILLTPQPTWVDMGGPLPQGCDAVLPPDAVMESPAGHEAIAAAAPGEGVAQPGFDARPETPLVRAGRVIDASMLAALHAAGIVRIAVRQPRIGLVRLSSAPPHVDATLSLIAAATLRAGGECVPLPADAAARLAFAVGEGELDGLIAIGGTGEGRGDRAASLVAAAGRLVLHGVGIRPGETVGLGIVEGRPTLMLPGRLDAALGAFLLLGTAFLHRLTGSANPAGLLPVRPLARKLVSSVGLAEAVLVADAEDGVRPIASGSFPLAALAHAAGWVLVPPESEGYASGAEVAVRPLP